MSYQHIGALLLLLPSTLAASAYTSTQSQTPKDNNADCSCYVVESGDSAQSPQYFQYYRFYDFRGLDGALDTAPPLLNDTQTASEEPTWQPKLFNSEAWNHDWNIQNWGKPSTDEFPVPMNNSLANIYLGNDKDADTSYLALRTSRLDTAQQTAGEIENLQKNLMHASLRMYGRVRGSKGAVAGFFTFYDDDNESDIEILTADPKDQIRYTNQPAVGDDGNEVAAASVGPTDLARWDEWQTHRIDWLPKNSYWFLNGEQVAANTYSVPRKPSFLVLNMWSDGGEWSGEMEVGDSAEFHVQWIEMAFNTSGPYVGLDYEEEEKRKRRGAGLVEREEEGCKTVCKIDGVKTVGTPEVLDSAAVGMRVSWGLVVVVGLVSLVVGY
ncbi:concanavalin A-like lectin/glucanase [Decorospora gaudefroyi]|uniref:Concanavalin A-like lectin/glucanase n=1 Tax=Decorospora gaudefroyi TaxID=184978 RepID=A0A6A5KL73_9PLEO|nr:concanavalin A-like lectin/glucanase [Decorospora gaudefroyi]